MHSGSDHEETTAALLVEGGRFHVTRGSTDDLNDL